MQSSTDHHYLDKQITQYKNEVTLLRHTIETWNTINDIPYDAKYIRFTKSNHYIDRLNLMQKLSNFEMIEKQQYILDQTVFKKIDDLLHYARKALRQKYETI